MLLLLLLLLMLLQACQLRLVSVVCGGVGHQMLLVERRLCLLQLALLQLLRRDDSFEMHACVWRVELWGAVSCSRRCRRRCERIGGGGRGRAHGGSGSQVAERIGSGGQRLRIASCVHVLLLLLLLHVHVV